MNAFRGVYMDMVYKHPASLHSFINWLAEEIGATYDVAREFMAIYLKPKSEKNES
jgi:hypothetical protein